MLDYVAVVTAGGIFVWTFDFGASHASPLHSCQKETEKYIFLIRNLFSNELSRESGLRNASGSLLAEPFCVEWSMAEKLVFVAIYRRVLNLVWVREFLESFQREFLKKYVQLSVEGLHFFKSGQCVDFETEVSCLLSAHENSSLKSSQPKFPSNVGGKKKGVSASEQPTKSRVWELENKNDSTLDYSAEQQKDSSEEIRARLQKMMLPESKLPVETAVTAEKPSGASSKISGFLKSFVEGKVLTSETLLELKPKLKELLMGKNVASDVAETVCNSVIASLTGKKVSAFKSPFVLLKEAASLAIEEILLPNSTLDLRQEVQKHLAADRRPYTIAFVGVNGVGKSTNLSKVCYYLLQIKCKILIAACDTFRSGAVEQLRTHVRNLKILDANASVDIFERGYGKDPANIAKEAIKHAKNNGYDVVLIDTAGRMQDNEPLMRSLAALVYGNPIEKIVFVGEALVGNEAVDQLTKFNQAIKDFEGGAAKKTSRRIDAILLTKFDTVDDKVGAALSMSYVAKAPIMFVGTGQTYTDLKKINVDKIVEVLLK